MTERNPNIAVLMGLTVVAFAIRVYALGDLGFRWDEDLTAITVKAVNEHGYPLLESGMVYPRFLPLQYLLAAWTSVFGFSEFTIRFPVVVFGTALVPITYLIARDLVDGRVALIAAAFMALDFWQIELARTARMYAPFFVVYALFVICVYRGFLWQERGWRIAALPVGLLAILLHDVGLFCAALVLVPVVLQREWRSRPLPYVVSAILVGFTALLRRFSGAMWSLSQRAEVAATESQRLLLADSFGGVQRLLDKLGFLHLPEFPMLRGVWSTSLGAILWTVVACVSLVIVVRIVRGQHWLAVTVAFLAVVSALVHQFTLSFALLAVFAGLQFNGARGLLGRSTLALGLVLVVLVALWALAGVLLGGYGLGEAKYFIQSIFEYPRFRVVMAYPMYRPVMTVVAAIGALALFDRLARRGGDDRSAMLLAFFVISYFTVGMFASTYSHFRYVLHADVFFMILASVGTLVLAQAGVNAYRSRARGRQPSTKAVLVGAALVCLIVVNPVRSVLAVTRDYTADSTLERWMNLGAWPDYKTTSAYILANMAPSDQVFVLEPREYYNYLGKVDGWVRSHNFSVQVVYWGGIAHDKYIGVPLIHTLEDLKEALASHDGRTWLPFRRRVLEGDGAGGVDDEIAGFLRANADRLAMTGADGSTLVYLFAAGSAAVAGQAREINGIPACGNIDPQR